jgi:predicted PurR-regulated permease PerM
MLTQQELNTITNGLQSNNQKIADANKTKEQQQLDQRTIQLQQQQLHQQATNQKIIIGGLVIAVILVIVLAIYTTHKVRLDNAKMRAKKP